MRYKKQTQEEPKKEIHYWIREWTAQEYKDNTQQLLEIGREYDGCQRISDENKDRKPRLFASDYYQIQNKGMTEKFEILRDPSLDNQRYDINKAKLDKFHNWKMFNRTPDQIALDKIQYAERSKAITDMLQDILLTNNTSHKL